MIDMVVKRPTRRGPKHLSTSQRVIKHRDSSDPATVPCPKCASKDNRTIDARPAGNTVRRRRQCICGHRFTTYECLAVEDVIDFQI